jgi:hypothetical protein
MMFNIELFLQKVSLAPHATWLTARDAVGTFGNAADRMGVEVASYASTASRILSPQAIEVGTPAGSDLHRAALRLADHETVVVPDAPVSPGEARLVTDGAVEGAADSPVGLKSLVTHEVDSE